MTVPPPWTAETIAEPVRAALESADLETMGSLLSPNATWGAPGQEPPTCRNRQQILKWYGNGRAFGARATVTELTVVGDRLLVGLAITSGPDPEHALSPERWQILTVAADGVSDIRGYESRPEAAEAVGLPV